MAPDRDDLRRRPGVHGYLWGAWASACVTAAILVAVAIDSRGRAWTGDPAAHHAHVLAVAEAALPLMVGDWVGEKVDVPPAAVKLLRPNLLSNRRFRNAATGETVSVLVVQCGDARDLVGHFPPVCYPAHGLIDRGAATRDWVVAGRQFPGMRYRFSNDSISSFSQLVVDNFMVLPDGRIVRDMDGLRLVAKDRRLRVYGAAQVQVVTDGTMSDTRRDEVLHTLLEPSLPLIMSLTAEAKHD